MARRKKSIGKNGDLDDDEDHDNDSKTTKQSKQTNQKSGSSNKSLKMQSSVPSYTPFYSDLWFWLFASTLIVLIGALIYISAFGQSSCRCSRKGKKPHFDDEDLEYGLQQEFE